MGNELFKNIPSKVGDLVKDVRNGRIGLPDLQRPFVWKDNKVRELFDSMLKGYPIGYIMLWESPADYESKKSTIGDNSKTYEDPKELVIDGQQRLTALVAAMFAVKVKDKNFADREIKISYNPLTREFAVWSQAYFSSLASLSIMLCCRSMSGVGISMFKKESIMRLCTVVPVFTRVLMILSSCDRIA